MRITFEMLCKMGVCEEHIKFFEAEWPEGVKLTRDFLETDIVLRIGLECFAQNLCPEIFEPVQIAHEEALTTLQFSYEKTTEPIYQRYLETPGAWVSYQAALAPDRGVYEEQLCTIEENYYEALIKIILEQA